MPDTDLLTPAEAAIVTSMTVRQVNKLIDEELPARVRPVRGGRRFVTASGAACLRARKQVSGLLTGAARRQMYKVIVEGKTEAMLLGELLSIDIAAIRRETARKVADLRRTRTLATSEPETLGGRLCFRDTRIPVAQIDELLAQGADVDELLEDYPSLTREMIEAAPTLAKAYPARGRPPTRPWAAEGPVSETRTPRG